MTPTETSIGQNNTNDDKLQQEMHSLLGKNAKNIAKQCKSCIINCAKQGQNEVMRSKIGFTDGISPIFRDKDINVFLRKYGRDFQNM